MVCCKVIYVPGEVSALPLSLYPPCIPLLHFQGVGSLERLCEWKKPQHGIVSQRAMLSKKLQMNLAARRAYETW